MTEPSDDEMEKLERHLRTKWQPGLKRPQGLSSDERRMAERVFGRSNVDRSINARDGQRVRPVPVVVTFVYWWIAWGFGSVECRIERIENGRRSDHLWDHDQRTSEQEIVHLRKQGFTVREIHMGLQPRRKDQKPTSDRRAILEKLRGFRHD